MDVKSSILNVMSHTKSWEEIRKIDGAKRYVALYATKPHQKKVPTWFGDIGRFWGTSRDVRKKRERPKIIELTEGELREVLRQQGKKVCDWDVIPTHLWGIDDPGLD